MVFSSPRAELEDCQAYMKKVFECNKEKPFTRYFGGCDVEEREFNRCLMREKTRRKHRSIKRFQKRNSVSTKMNPPLIEDSFEKLDKYPTVVERYYSKYYYKPDGLDEDETHCILIHSNRICLVTLAESHPVVKNKKKISSISFQITEKLDRTDNKVTGKGKKGAQFMAQNSILCFIACEDGSKYSVYGCVKGKLIEINQNLVENFQLLVDKPLSEGYIGIILPNLREVEEMKKGFQLCSENSAPCFEQDD